MVYLQMAITLTQAWHIVIGWNDKVHLACLMYIDTWWYLALWRRNMMKYVRMFFADIALKMWITRKCLSNSIINITHSIPLWSLRFDHQEVGLCAPDVLKERRPTSHKRFWTLATDFPELSFIPIVSNLETNLYIYIFEIYYYVTFIIHTSILWVM